MNADTTKRDSDEAHKHVEAFARNYASVLQKSQRLLSEYIERQETPAAGKDLWTSAPMGAAMAFMQMMAHAAIDPVKLARQQMEFMNDYSRLVAYFTSRMLGLPAEPVSAPQPKDRRFRDEAWTESVVFDFIKQSYLLSSSWLTRVANEQEAEMDDKTAHKIDFYTRQFVDAMSPANFPFTNPEVIKQTLASKGENLVHGFENLLKDIENGRGQLKIRSADDRAFEIGKNIATTPGKVVFQNDLLQLIQYSPTTAQVHKTPLLIVSPWINKYYILDLKPENSFVKWLTDQGYTVFITSWVNPDKRHKDEGFADYMMDGPLAALDAIEKATGEKQANVIGYCIGGTLVATMLAYLSQQKKASRVKSVTYLTTLVDFSDPGDLGVFVDELQLEELDQKLEANGYLKGSEMAAVFSALRANEMIWSLVINNYMLGKAPLPFDLLYWNADNTRMPAKCHAFYMRSMYLQNLLVKPGGVSIDGVPIDLGKITTPTYIMATREDHIVPWQASYKGTQIYKGQVRFVLSGSGHVAGVVNPPSANKYGYSTNNKVPASPTEWLSGAKDHPGSWWKDWDAWQKENGFLGGKVKARVPGKGGLKAIENAPGSYVKVRCD